MRWRSILSLSFCGLAACVRAQQPGIDQDWCTPAAKDTLSICAGTIVPVFFLSGANSEGKTAPVLVVASDVKVDHNVVIAKGSIVLTSVYGTPAHIFTINDAFLDVQILSVSSVTGDTVPLAGSLQRSVERGWKCSDESCFPDFLPARAKIELGTLIVVSVRETVQLGRGAVEKSNYKSGTGSKDVPSTYVYTKEIDHRVGVHVDGQPAGHLSSFRYGCLSLPPGEHSLRIDHSVMTIHIVKGQNAYISVEQQYPRDKEPSLRLTDGFELASDVLRPTDLNNSPFWTCLPAPSIKSSIGGIARFWPVRDASLARNEESHQETETWA